MNQAPSDKWLTWQRGDPATKKQAVWKEHKETGLDVQLRALIEHFGPPDAVKIRRRPKP